MHEIEKWATVRATWSFVGPKAVEYDIKELRCLAVDPGRSELFERAALWIHHSKVEPLLQSMAHGMPLGHLLHKAQCYTPSTSNGDPSKGCMATLDALMTSLLLEEETERGDSWVASWLCAFFQELRGREKALPREWYGATIKVVRELHAMAREKAVLLPWHHSMSNCLPQSIPPEILRSMSPPRPQTLVKLAAVSARLSLGTYTIIRLVPFERGLRAV